ncbi:MAG: hypothetical protein JSW62_03090 [Thermoplasmatales archaeon]|nr:MAG: hypothetical protein JSW62_03090 [Thermoplasmatales archaeon]
MEYIQNTAINCPYCMAHIAAGRERSTPMRNGNTLFECVWSCPQCGMCARRDEKVIPKPKETKIDEPKEEKKQ